MASNGAKSVVVTGANSGIGLSTVLELAGAGYDVIGTARTKEKAAVITRAAADKGTTVRTVVMDIGDAESTEKGFVEVAELTDGGPWAVVNNAGFAQAGAIEDVDDEAARYQLEVNVIAPARIARLVLPSMREAGDGRIVNISSIAGRMSNPLMGWYCASKHALEAMSDALRIEVEPFGVKVILIEPGSFGTNVWATGAATLPDPSNATYAAAYARVDAVHKRSRFMPDAVWVARTIRLALANPLPMSRYLVGVDAVSGVVAETMLPSAITDYAKGVATGLKRLPVSLPFLGGR